MERRLAAIMAAEVVGYSRLKGVDEEATFSALKAYRSVFIDAKIAECHGRVVKLIGDRAPVEFPRIVESVQCAVAIQRGMAKRRAEEPDDRRIVSRIGVNLGDVMVEGDDIYGDGVKGAARLEALAEPGGVIRLTHGLAMKRLCLSLCLSVALAASTFAQDDPQPRAPSMATDALIDSIQARIDKMAKARSDTEAALEILERRMVEAIDRLSSRQEENYALRQRAIGLSTEIEARLAEEKERTALVQREREEREMRALVLLERAQAAERSYEKERGVSEVAQRRLAVLDRQLLELRKQFATLNAVLEASEAKSREQQAFIVALGQRLNHALAMKLQELAKYRSAFLGRLREVLGERGGVTIVGDRFVIQSGGLFDTASAKLEKEGKVQLKTLAKTFLEIAEEIPEDIPWILRVDGHTDVRPIFSPEYPSNWELSTARAMSVVRFLIAEGAPPERLTAAGFGEYQPLDPRDDEIAYRRNRRIEFRLTQK